MAPNHSGQVHGKQYIQQETEGPVNTWVSVMSGDIRGILNNSGKPIPVEAHCGVFIPLTLTAKIYSLQRFQLPQRTREGRVREA